MRSIKVMLIVSLIAVSALWLGTPSGTAQSSVNPLYEIKAWIEDLKIITEQDDGFLLWGKAELLLILEVIYGSKYQIFYIPATDPYYFQMDTPGTIGTFGIRYEECAPLSSLNLILHVIEVDNEDFGKALRDALVGAGGTIVGAVASALTGPWIGGAIGIVVGMAFDRLLTPTLNANDYLGGIDIIFTTPRNLTFPNIKDQDRPLSRDALLRNLGARVIAGPDFEATFKLEVTEKNKECRPTGMPTMTQWGLLVLGVLLAGSLAFMIRRRFTVRPAGA